MFSTTIECKTLAEAVQALERIVARLRNAPTRPILEMCGRMVHVRTLKNFLDSEAPDGTPWAPVRWRPGWRPGLTYKPLIRTGLLMTSAAKATASPSFWGDSTIAGLNIDASVPWYGERHLTGEGNMPARPWLGVSEPMVDEMNDRSADMMLGWVVVGSWAA